MCCCGLVLFCWLSSLWLVVVVSLFCFVDCCVVIVSLLFVVVGCLMLFNVCCLLCVVLSLCFDRWVLVVVCRGFCLIIVGGWLLLFVVCLCVLIVVCVLGMFDGIVCRLLFVVVCLWLLFVVFGCYGLLSSLCVVWRCCLILLVWQCALNWSLFFVETLILN